MTRSIFFFNTQKSVNFLFCITTTSGMQKGVYILGLRGIMRHKCVRNWEELCQRSIKNLMKDEEGFRGK